jgi:hypothetical protein
MSADRPVMLLADAPGTEDYRANELQLGMDAKHRCILVLKRGDQVMWYPLTADHTKRLQEGLTRAMLGGLIG